MYEIIPTSDPAEETVSRCKAVDKTYENGMDHLENQNERLDLTECKTANRHSNSCNDSGFDDLFESDTTEKTCLLSDISDSSSHDNNQTDKESPVFGISECGINYHDYAAALKDVPKQVDKRENGKKKKVRISEDVTDIKMIPHRYEYCVNYSSGYHGYKNGSKNDKRFNGSQNNWNNKNKNRYYYRYYFDTKKAGRHYTAWWEEDDDNVTSHGNSTKIPSDEVKITVTDTSEHPTSTEEESTVIHPSSDPTDSPPGHWPLKRSQSVDSRDNPFLPGGDLSKEAEEILSRATIIRDKFILKDNERNQEQISLSSPTKPNPEEPKQEVESNALPVEETVSAEVANMAESVPNARVKENGQITESEDSLTPGSVKMELMEENKDKKKQKKCCTIM